MNTSYRTDLNALAIDEAIYSRLSNAGSTLMTARENHGLEPYQVLARAAKLLALERAGPGGAKFYLNAHTRETIDNPQYRNQRWKVRGICIDGVDMLVGVRKADPTFSYLFVQQFDWQDALRTGAVVPLVDEDGEQKCVCLKELGASGVATIDHALLLQDRQSLILTGLATQYQARDHVFSGIRAFDAEFNRFNPVRRSPTLYTPSLPNMMLGSLDYIASQLAKEYKAASRVRPRREA